MAAAAILCKRIAYDRYGPAELLHIQDAYTCPAPAEHEIRIRVQAVSLNPMDYKVRSPEPPDPIDS